MYRIFGSLSLFAMALLVANLIVGLLGPNYNALSTAYRSQIRSDTPTGGGPDVVLDEAQLSILRKEVESAQAQVRVHMLLGILATIVAVLVQSVGVTYFIGTGRWCKEVAETYELDSSWIRQANRTKRRSFVWSMLGIATVLAIAAFGAAADPGTLGDATFRWVRPHRWMAIAGTFLIAWCLLRQLSAIGRHQSIIEAILDEVKRIRQARGLEVENA